MRRVFHQAYRRAFTLVELSVVVVILSILIATVLVSRNLIANAKIEKIMEEFRSFNTAVSTFSDTYGCLPGDCNANQVADLVTKNLSTACTDGTNGPINTGLVDRVGKRTCMMYSLKLSAFNSPADTLVMTTSFSASVAGSTIPVAKFDSGAAWDFRSATGFTDALQQQDYAAASFPVEVGSGKDQFTGEAYLGTLLNRHMFVLRDANTATEQNELFYDIASIIRPALYLGTTKYGINSLMAHKLDTKFDDGLPYGGNIIGGKTATGLYTDTMGTICNTGNTTQGCAAAKYTDSVDITKGCLVAFITNY
jgi:prepilin-type N-terminal cleavage/methylation domain-containing protein